jgi:hypothetical protein
VSVLFQSSSLNLLIALRINNADFDPCNMREFRNVCSSTRASLMTGQVSETLTATRINACGGTEIKMSGLDEDPRKFGESSYGPNKF